ncbi:MFS transporter [Francisella tularensis]|uniref:MFS transporter n=1 Tax=Francisella tularensis TaxID=263 RepID=UPI000158AEFD|nr:MFS transporter [Francisella tularensis]AJI45005.1 major Facilitator Superfamily protein [Francisella tularensis subsp. novicida F6168]APC98518.1 major Facilitator Superfamily protein [Francisella tularensis subsp. novicida]EDN36248.1 sugar:cation symporter family protein [Francisella tularensis subsp. novicida GA99-3549]
MQKLKLRNYICYGMGDIFGGGAFVLIGTFFMIFLTNNVGLSPILAGLLFGFGRFWMAITDPFFGNLSDRTNTRFGRRRVFFLVGIIPIIITFIPMWMTPLKVGVNNVTDIQAFIYYLTMYCIFDIVYSMVITPYAALIADMTNEYNERVRLSAFRMGFSQFSSILATSVAPIILATYTYSDKAYIIMATMFSILYAIVWIAVFFGTKEITISNKIVKQHKETFVSKITTLVYSFASAFKNKSFRAQLGLYLFAFTAVDFLMTLSVYFIKTYLEKPELVSYISTMWLAQICVLPIYVFIANKFSQATSYRIGAVIWLLSMLGLLLLNQNNATALTISISFILIGIGLSPCYMIPMAMLSFVTEVDVLLSKERRTGVYAGAMSSARKVSQGLIVLPLIGLILQMIGYNPHLAYQSASTLSSLRYVFIFVPIILILIGIYFSTRFKITPKNFEIIKDEISRLEKGGSKAEVNQEVKIVCENLTGTKYENLYKR